MNSKLPKILRFLIVPGLMAAMLGLTACTPDDEAYKSKVPVTKNVIETAQGNGNEGLDEAPAKTSVPAPAPKSKPATPSTKPVPVEVQPSEPAPLAALPSQINLDIPFYPQAPDADWSLPWQEACEEASVIQAYYYTIGAPLSKDQFRQDILNLVEWQKKEFNDYIHTTVDQTAQMIRGYFKFDGFKIIENPTLETLQGALAEGRAIVAPFKGRDLENPFFSGEGPFYHVIVLKGYDGKNFITNDVGTRRGHNFIYPYSNIMGSLHDYFADNMDLGAKRVIVFDLPKS